MKYKVRHTTRYEYSEAVTHCYNLGYVLPRNTKQQKVLDTKIIVSPKADEASVRQDYYKNQFYHFTIESPHEVLDVTVNSLLAVEDNPDIDLVAGVTCSEALEIIAKAEDISTLKSREFILESPFIGVQPELADYARSSLLNDRPLTSAVMDLTTRIFNDFTYDPGFSNVSTPLKDVLKHKRGVCQDFAHLAIACLRSLGFPARYVSGYLETLPPPGKEKLVGADATHAWFSAYVPGTGWLDYDPTNNKMSGTQHLVTAWGRDYSDVPPLKGILFGGGDTSTLTVEVDVVRVVDEPQEEQVP